MTTPGHGAAPMAATLAATLLLGACTAAAAPSPTPGGAPPTTPGGASPSPIVASPTPSPAQAGPIVVGSPPVATVTMRDDGCVYSGPTQLVAGDVVLGLVNQSTGQFDADLWLMNTGHGYDELAAHIAEEERRLESGEPGLGHPTFARLVAEASVVNGRGALTTKLAPGTYGVACIRFEGGEPVRYWAAGPLTIAE